MGSLFVYEGWASQKDRASDAAELVDFCTAFAPGADQVKLSVAGRNQERRILVRDLVETAKVIETSWSITALDKSSIFRKHGLISSDNYWTIIMHRDFRAVHIYAASVDSLSPGCQTQLDLLRNMVAGVRESGFGYCLRGFDPVDSSIYALDLKIARSPQQLHDSLFGSARLPWESNFFDSSKRRARDLFEVNLWSKPFAEQIINRLNDSGNGAVRLIDLSTNEVIAFVNSEAIPLVKRMINDLLFEPQSKAC